MSSKKAPAPPKARHNIHVSKPGAERPPIDLSDIPPLVGGSTRLAFMADQQICDDINRHLDFLAEKAPGIPISVSDGIRSLIHKGAQAYRAEQQPQEDSDK